MKGKKTGKRYGKEFIVGAVRLVVERGYTMAEASRQLGVSAWSLGQWVKKYQKTGELVVDSKSESLVEEVKRLRSENQRLRMEKEILKKAARYFATELP